MVSLKSRLKNSVRLPATFGEGQINRAVIDRGAWTSLKSSVWLPTGEFDEGRAINLVATYLVPLVFGTFKPEFSRERLETALLTLLRKGDPEFAIAAVKFANAGDEIADKALRIVFAEMDAAGGALPGQGIGHVQVKAYGQCVVLQRSPPKRRGRRWHDNWARDVEICLLIIAVSRGFDIPYTRNRAARRAPSAISIVVAALKDRGRHLEETTVQEKIWCGLTGEAVRFIVQEHYAPQN